MKGNGSKPEMIEVPVVQTRARAPARTPARTAAVKIAGGAARVAGAAQERERAKTTKPAGESVSAVDFVAGAIRTQIRERMLVAGQRLVETDLMARFQVGRGTVRDALQRLAGDGVVKIEHHKGAIVRLLSREEFVKLIEVRAVLEGLAARLAANNVGEKRLRQRLVALQKEFDMQASARSFSVAQYMDYNEEFHDLLLEMSGDSNLARMIKESQGTLFRLQFHFMIDARSVARGNAAHKAVLEAILAGAGAAAERAMRAHIRRSIQLVNQASDRIFT